MSSLCLSSLSPPAPSACPPCLPCPIDRQQRHLCSVSNHVYCEPGFHLSFISYHCRGDTVFTCIFTRFFWFGGSKTCFLLCSFFFLVFHVLITVFFIIIFYLLIYAYAFYFLVAFYRNGFPHFVTEICRKAQIFTLNFKAGDDSSVHLHLYTYNMCMHSLTYSYSSFL